MNYTIRHRSHMAENRAPKGAQELHTHDTPVSIGASSEADETEMTREE